LECVKNNFPQFNIVNIRFKNKDFVYYINYFYEKNIDKKNILDEIIELINKFNENKIDTLNFKFISNEFKKLNIKSTSELHNPKSKSDLTKKEALEKVLTLAKNTYQK
jgi:hypothetical protein